MKKSTLIALAITAAVLVVVVPVAHAASSGSR